MKQYKNMTESPVGKLIILNAVPTMMSMVITAFYNAADTYFVAKLGTSAAGAVGIVFSVMSIIQALGNTFGMGACNLISQLLGKKEEDKAIIIANSGILGAGTVGVLLAVVGNIYIEKIMRLLGATETILPYAISYGRYIFGAAPITMEVFTLNMLFRAEGKAKYGTRAIILGGIINIVLNPIFIFTFRLDIAGAAIATAISQFISFCYLLWMFFHRDVIIKITPYKISKEGKTYVEIIRVGLPSLCRQGLACLSNIMLNTQAAMFGDVAVAAMTVVNKLFGIVFSLELGYNQGYQPVVGYNYGAGKYKRVKEAYLFLLKSSVSVLFVIGCLTYAFAPFLIFFFVGQDKEVVEIGIKAYRMQCITMPLLPFVLSCNTTFQSIGKALWSILTSSARQGFFFLPAIWILPKFLGLTGLEMTQAVADICTFFMAIPFILHFFRKLNGEIINEATEK